MARGIKNERLGVVFTDDLSAYEPLRVSKSGKAILLGYGEDKMYWCPMSIWERWAEEGDKSAFRWFAENAKTPSCFRKESDAPLDKAAAATKKANEAKDRKALDYRRMLTANAIAGSDNASLAIMRGMC